MLEAAGITVDWTEDVAVLGSRINNYKAIIFASSNRDTLWNSEVATSNDAARTALRNYMRRGGGFVGLHNAFGAEYNWPYYEGLLGNANFYNHGPNRAGTVDHRQGRLDRGRAGALRLPGRVVQPDAVPHQREVPARRSTPAPCAADGGAAPRTRPASIPWPGASTTTAAAPGCSTLGHNTHSFAADLSGPGAEAFQRMVVQGVKSAMGLIPFCTTE